MLKLARYYGVSLDRIAFEEGDSQLMHYSRSDAEPSGAMESLLQIKSQLEQLQTDENPQLWHLSNDLPFFWYFFFPEITAFKLLIWSYIANPKEGVGAHNFDPASFSDQHPEIDALRKDIARLYANLPSVEIWPPQFTEHILNQIQKTLEAHVISAASAGLLLNTLVRLINLIGSAAASGTKSRPDSHEPGAPIQLYLNELILSSEMVFTESSSGTTVFIPLDTPNFLGSGQTGFNVHIRQYMESVMQVSTRISKDGELVRQKVLRQARQRVERFREEMRLPTP